MEIYRISKKAFSQIDGVGGLYYPGRWHNAGYKVVYAAGHRSLSVLESLVHLSKTHFLENDFVLSSIYVPDNIELQSISIAELSTKWTRLQNSMETRDIGTKFLQASQYLILKVPSAIIKEEYNYIINPVHPKFSQCKIVKQVPFSFDGRLLSM